MPKEKRIKIGIYIDYVLRTPSFKDCYSKCKTEILSGTDDNFIKSTKDVSGRDFWSSLSKKSLEEYSFYETSLIPQENFGPTFDISYSKYFKNKEHLLKFLEDWSYNLYGQGSVNNAADVRLINTCQSKVCDVYLLDKTTHSRKVTNTLAFLSRSQLFVKGVEFVNEKENLEEEYFAIYDPYKDSELILTPLNKQGEPSEKFLDFFIDLEKKIKNIKK